MLTALRSTKETDYWHIKSDIYDFLIQIYAKQTQNFHAFSRFFKLQKDGRAETIWEIAMHVA